jgi:hypothetical protein
MTVAVVVAQLFGPLLLAGEDRAHLYRLLRDLLDATEVDDETFGRYTDLLDIGTLQEIAALVAALDDPDDPREPGDIVGALVPLVDSVVEAVHRLDTQPPSDVDWGELAQLLPGYLLGRYLTDQVPVLGAVLGLLGTMRTVNDYQLLELDEVGSLLADPPQHLTTAYGWGGRFDYPLLLDRLEALAVATRCPVTRRAGASGHDELVVVVLDADARLALTVGPALTCTKVDGVAVTIGLLGPLGLAALGPQWSVDIGEGSDGAGAELRPGSVSATGPPATLVLTGRPDAPWPLLTLPSGTGLELGGASVTLFAAGDDAGIAVETALRLALGGAEFDSFLSSAVGGGDVAVEADTSLALSVRDGLTVGGTASFEVTVIVERGFGPLWIHRLDLALRLAGDTLELLATLAASAEVGPLQGAIDGLGVRVTLTRSGDLALAFQPPRGVGLGLDAGVVSGGGYLYLDPPAGEYAGVAEFRALGIGIAAIGIVDTKAVDGWSLFFALYLSIPSIQLGFGFTLTGLGGLAGINRTMDSAALGAAVRAGAIDATLFPEDPVADAPFIIDQLQSMFPPSPGRYVFGPVIRIGWGTPSLIEAKLGIVISLPDPVVLALIGSVSSVLPHEDLDLVAMHLDVAGVIDFGAGTLAIDAALHDSHVAQYALSGDMSLRAAFVGRPDFLMALGGAHPGFDKPPGFPDLRRLSLAISVPALSVQFDCYFALASNSVQFGAAFQLGAEVAGFGVEGGSHFDALVYFSPFEIQTSIGCYVAVTAGGLDLAGVWLDASLEGPNPWLVVGTATFKVLGLHKKIRVDERIGSHRPDPDPAAEDLFDDVLTALSTVEAWRVVTPAGASGVLVADDDPASDELVAMPDGVLTVSQRAVPLNVTIDKAGDAPVAPYHHFTLEPIAGTEASGAVQDWFAPGYFFTLNATEQLSAPSFELLDAGIEVGGGDPVAGTGRVGSLDFEEIVRDPELGEDRVARQGRGRRTVGRRSTVDDYRTTAEEAPVRLREAGYAITDRHSGAVARRARTWSAAHQSAAGKAVVPAWEVPE